MLIVHGVKDVRLSEIPSTEPLVPEPCTIDVTLAILKLKGHKSSGIDQIPSELIKASGSKIPYEIYILIISIWNKEEIPEKW